jgi:uncharacterized protein
MKTDISRREFLGSAAAAALTSGAWARGAARAGASPTTSPFIDPLAEFDYGAVELTGGPLKQQYDRVRASYLALDNDRLLKVYRERAGLPAPGEPMGGWYGPDGFVPGHSLGQYISGLARLGRATDDAACRQKVHALVEGFAASFRAGGHIYAAPNAEKVWPCYVLDKHLAGLIDAHTLTGVEQARELLPQVFAGAQAYIPETGHDRVGKKDPPYDETYILPENLFAAYALTGERAFYERACAYLLDSDFFDPLARGEDVLPGRHAYSHVMALSSAARARLVLGDEKYLRAMQHAWEFLVTEQQYASGGWGPDELFVEPHKGRLYESLLTTHDHFETPCGTYAAMKLARALLCATGDGRYGDGLERVMYNALLAVKEPDGDGDFPYYSSYAAQSEKGYYAQKWPCCSGTLVQGVADYVKNIYFRSEDGVVVNLYAPSRVRWNCAGVAVTLTQDGECAFDDAVTLAVECAQPVEFALGLRVPAWLDQSPAFEVNQKPASAHTHHAVATLRRKWRSGDTLTVSMPRNFRTEAIDRQHSRTVAMLRGPLLYAERSPSGEKSTLAPLDALRPFEQRGGGFEALTAGATRAFVPLYSVGGERYTVYFDKA